MKNDYLNYSVKQLIIDKEMYSNLVQKMELQQNKTPYEEKLLKIYRDELIRIKNNLGELVD